MHIKKLINVTILLSFINLTSHAMTSDTWLQHLNQYTINHLSTLKNQDSILIGETKDKKKNFGTNFGIRIQYKSTLESLPELIKNYSSKEPFRIYTFGAGSQPLFELHCILAGLHNGERKIEVIISDIQKEIVIEGSKYISKALTKMQENGLIMPKISTIYKTVVAGIPHEIDKRPSLSDDGANMIVASSVLHFVGGEDIVKFFKSAYKKLRAGGRLLVIAQAPNGHSVMNVYEQQLNQGNPWPGLIKTKILNLLCPSNTNTQTPKEITLAAPMSKEESPGDITNDRSTCFHYLSLPLLEKIGTEAGFTILESSYVIAGKFYPLSKITNKDLRESIYPYQSTIIFEKPRN